MATKPRQILPGRTWFVTGRAIARQHRFVPKDRVVETLWYCLAVAAHKYEVQMHGFMWMSNHYHLVLTDVAAELPDFMRDLNSLISKALNAFRGIRGQNFDRRGYNAVVVADGGKLLSHCACTEANPCRAGLVDLAREWESVTSANLEYGQRVAVQRPTYGLWSQAKSGGSGGVDPGRAMHCGRIKCPEVAPRMWLIFDHIPVWLSRKTMSPKGWRLTKNYRAPKMPWGLANSQVKAFVEYWAGPTLECENLLVSDMNYYARGIQSLVFDEMLRLPGLSKITPGVTKTVLAGAGFCH